MKRKLTICLVMLMLITSIIPASAAVVPPDVEPMASYYSLATASIEKTGSNTVKGEGALLGVVGVTTKVKIILYLQENQSGSWVTVDDWTDTVNGCNLTASKTFRADPDGTYRIKATFYAYSGTKYESPTKYSGSITM